MELDVSDHEAGVASPVELERVRQASLDKYIALGLFKPSAALDRCVGLAARSVSLPVAVLGLLHEDAVFWLSWAGPGSALLTERAEMVGAMLYAPLLYDDKPPISCPYCPYALTCHSDTTIPSPLL